MAAGSRSSRAATTPARPLLRYRRRYVQCEVPPSDRDRLVAAIEQLPGAMTGQLHHLNIKPVQGTRRRGLMRLRVGAYRLSFWPVGDEIVVLEVDRKDDTTYNSVDRLAVHRRGAGVQVTAVREAPLPPERSVAGHAPSRAGSVRERENPL